MDREKLLDFLGIPAPIPAGAIGSGTRVIRPKELDDPSTPAELRASVQSAYTAALMDQPGHLLNASEKASIRAECQRVLAEDGFCG